MSALTQIGSITAMNLRNIPRRWAPSLVVVIGMAAVVGVVTTVLSMSVGFLQTAEKTGSPDRAMVMSSGAIYAGASSLPRGNEAIIGDAPGVRKGPDAKPVASPEFYRALLLVKKSDGLESYISVRGMGPQGWALRPEMKLVSGRMFRPAVNELIVGRMAQSRYLGLQVGDKVSLPSGDWTIVGAFESNGDEMESVLVGDIETLLSAYRANTFNDVTVRLESADKFNQFKDALTTNPALSVDVIREKEYYAKLAKPLADFMKIVAYFVGGIMALGAVFGALNTMYSSVSARSREIATLRAIGFGAGPVVASVVAEALLLAVAGAALGGGLAWLIFNGHVASGGFMGDYALAVTPGLLGMGIAVGLVIGLIGGLFPAIRAARLPVAEALRAT